jgi:hypothetical protein
VELISAVLSWVEDATTIASCNIRAPAAFHQLLITQLATFLNDDLPA